MTSSPILPIGLSVEFEEEESFYGVINRLKSQGALPAHCFLKELPFFNVPSLPIETQIKELFEISFDAELCRQLLKNVAPLPEGAELKILPQNYSPISVMSFAQIILYKVLPCPDNDCSKCPREIATHNQYRDFEYDCPFYHHERDRRRLVITPNPDEEFAYKANYFEEGRRRGEKEKHSQNYFESMFHPLYYKMFRCKRDFCNQSVCCPFHHSEEEKKMWDETFSNFIKKDRVSYVKDRQKFPERKPKGQESRRGSNDEEVMNKPNHGYLDKRAHIRQRYNKKQQSYQQPNQGYDERVEESKPVFEKILDFRQFLSSRKDSEDSSFEEKYSQGFFSKLQGTTSFPIY